MTDEPFEVTEWVTECGWHIADAEPDSPLVADESHSWVKLTDFQRHFVNRALAGEPVVISTARRTGKNAMYQALKEALLRGYVAHPPASPIEAAPNSQSSRGQVSNGLAMSRECHDEMHRIRTEQVAAAFRVPASMIERNPKITVIP